MQQPRMQPRTAIGLDVGRSAVKAVVAVKGVFTRLCYPSSVIPAYALTDESTAARALVDTVSFNGAEYFVGETARAQAPSGAHSGLSDEWFLGQDYQILVTSVFQKLARLEGIVGLEDAFVVVGLPGAILRGAKSDVEALTRKSLPSSCSLVITSQPHGAFASHVYATTGIVNRDRVYSGKNQKKFLILDVGLHTSDYMGVGDKFTVPERTIGYDAGLYTALEAIIKAVRDKYGFVLTPVDVEDALAEGKITRKGQEVDISKEIHAGLEGWANRLLSKATSLWSTDIDSASQILLGGGAASILHPFLAKTWPHCVVVDNHRMAIADGYCKMALSQLVTKV